MKLRVVGDLIVTDSGEVVATFSPRLLPTIRDTAEELLMQGAQPSDWELRERIFEYEGRIQVLEEELAVTTARIAEIVREMGNVF